MKLNIDIRVRHILNILNEWGQGYLVGGALRDLLLDKIPNDYDLATNISLNNLLHIFSEYNPIVLSYKYEIINICVDGLKMDISRYREEIDILDGRNPKKIKFLDDIKDDLKRRDFSINAIAYNESGFIDLYNGLEDLKNKKIDIISEDKLLRLKEDNTRILRAIYLIAKYDFKLSLKTKKAIEDFFLDNNFIISNKNYKKLIKKILFLPYSYKILNFLFEKNLLLNLSDNLSIDKLDSNIIENIINSYKIYCKYNAYEEKNIGYAILFVHLFYENISLENKLKTINILNEALERLELETLDIVLIRNLIFYSDCIDSNINKMYLKRMLFEFRNNQNVSKLLTFLSFINHNREDYTDRVRKILDLLAKIQSIYFKEEIVFVNDLDINVTDIFKLDFGSINREVLRKDLFEKINLKQIENKKKNIIEYISSKYDLKGKIKEDFSYGGVVYRKKEDKVEFLIVKIKNGNWGFPKGHIEKGETGVKAAIREIKEETSLDVTLIDVEKFAEKISYISDTNVLKFVTLYIAKTENLSDEIIIDKEELSDYKWCQYKEALKYITYTSQRNVLNKARLYIFK